jgi:hypothetical protein
MSFVYTGVSKASKDNLVLQIEADKAAEIRRQNRPEKIALLDERAPLVAATGSDAEARNAYFGHLEANAVQPEGVA